jgi:hypothetical protein
VSTSIIDTVASDEELILRWQVHIAKEQPHRFVGVILFIIAMAFLAFLWFGGNVFPAIVMAFVFCGALSDFFLPITFTLTKSHASASTLLGKRIMAWKDVKRCYLDDSGVKLSPLRRQSRLEAYRGVYLRFGDKNKDEVLNAVRNLRPENV